jgi:aspartyl-tRNA synthetase
MPNPYRSHTCNDLRASHAGQTVRLAGWIHNKRDLGGVLFIDLRDHYGITQIVIPPTAPFQDALAHLPKETVISVHGNVRPRHEGTVNPNIPTGEIELDVAGYDKLGGCESLPMNVFPEDHTPEETRLKYRFLDLRRSKLHKTVMLRAKVISAIRRRMIELGFQEFQTPILTSSSPEGARDFLVPSRLYPGEFYALPQAPQQFKQLLMVSGFDRYFQIAPCFRDEDGRADRTPGEFYQLDVEMSFVTQDDVFAAMEKLFVPLFAEFKSEWPTNASSEGTFQRIPYKESMLRFGTDKPDMRIPFEIKDLTPFFAQSEFKAFAGKTVRAFAVPQAFDQPRSWFDNLQEEAKKLGAPGLAYVKVDATGEITGPIAKFMVGHEIRRGLFEVAGKGMFVGHPEAIPTAAPALEPNPGAASAPVEPPPQPSTSFPFNRVATDRPGDIGNVLAKDRHGNVVPIPQTKTVTKIGPSVTGQVGSQPDAANEFVKQYKEQLIPILAKELAPKLFEKGNEEALKTRITELVDIQLAADKVPIGRQLRLKLLGDIIDEIVYQGTKGRTVIFFSADANETKAAKVLGAMRVKIAEQLNLIEKDVFKFAWIVDYPMFEMNEETKAIEFSHNPFSMPQGGLDALEKQDPLTIFAYQYDLVCNGYEIASGAIRNHIPEIMYKAFALAGHGKEFVDTEFAGMINAFKYGAPPHGGIAPGIDRIVMLLANESSIREVIAFPMAQNGRDLLMNAPSPVSEKQLRDVHLTIRKPVPKV